MLKKLFTKTKHLFGVPSFIDREEKLSPGKLHTAQYFVVLMLIVLAAQLWRLQVLRTRDFQQSAQHNRIRKIPLIAARGKLFDRENRLTVDNYSSISCFLARERGRDVDADLPLIARGLNLDLQQLRTNLRRNRASSRFQPILLKENITSDEL